jgi:hypothetical protein
MCGKTRPIAAFAQNPRGLDADVSEALRFVLPVAARRARIGMNHTDHRSVMSGREEIVRLLKEAAASMKTDAKGAVAKLESAYALVRETGDADDTATVAEELARGWTRRRSGARSLYYAAKATKLAPKWKTAWTTLAKTCELVASKIVAEDKQVRARALYDKASTAFKTAATLTKDPEDKRWLLELAADAAKQAKPPRET